MTNRHTAKLTLPGAATPALRNINKKWMIGNAALVIPSDLHPRREHLANRWHPVFQRRLEAIMNIARPHELVVVQEHLRMAIDARCYRGPKRVAHLTLKDLVLVERRMRKKREAEAQIAVQDFQYVVHTSERDRIDNQANDDDEDSINPSFTNVPTVQELLSQAKPVLLERVRKFHVRNSRTGYPTRQHLLNVGQEAHSPDLDDPERKYTVSANIPEQIDIGGHARQTRGYQLITTNEH